MNLLVFLAVVALASGTLDRKPYYRSSSKENDEKQETMQFIAQKRDRVNQIDWDNFNPSAVKNRGPARDARVSALIDRMEANNIPPSNTITPYETKSDHNVEAPKKSFGYGYGSGYQSPVKAPVFKRNVTPHADATSSTSKYQVKESGAGSYKTSSKPPSLSLKITYASPQGSFRTDESSAESQTSKYETKRSSYGSYEDDSDDESSVVRPPARTSKINVRTQESSIKSPTPKYQPKRPSYGSYEDDSDDESSVVRPPTRTSKINVRTEEPSIKSPTTKYQAKKPSYGKHEADSDDESPVIRPPVPMSKINVGTQEPSIKSPTPKYQAKKPSYGKHEADSDDESPVIRPPVPSSKINLRSQEPSIKSPTPKYETRNSDYGLHKADSEYVSPGLKSTTIEPKMHITTPPDSTKSSKPTYQGSGYSSYKATQDYVSSSVKTTAPESNVHAISPPAFSKSSTSSFQIKSPVSIHENKAEGQTPLSEIDHRKSYETPVESSSKLQAARSLLSSSTQKIHEGLVPNVKLPSSSAKIPVPLVPKRSNGITTPAQSFAVASQPAPNLEMSSPATEKSSPPPPSWMDTAKFMSNSRKSRMNMAQQTNSNQKTSDESFVGSIKTPVSPEDSLAHRNQKEDEHDSIKGTYKETTGIYKRVMPTTIKPSFYTFPRIPNKYVSSY